MASLFLLLFRGVYQKILTFSVGGVILIKNFMFLWVGFTLWSPWVWGKEELGSDPQTQDSRFFNGFEGSPFTKIWYDGFSERLFYRVKVEFTDPATSTTREHTLVAIDHIPIRTLVDSCLNQKLNLHIDPGSPHPEVSSAKIRLCVEEYLGRNFVSFLKSIDIDMDQAQIEAIRVHEINKSPLTEEEIKARVTKPNWSSPLSKNSIHSLNSVALTLHRLVIQWPPSLIEDFPQAPVREDYLYKLEDYLDNK